MPSPGTPILIPPEILNTLTPQTATQTLWRTCEEQMRDFVQHKRFGTISTTWQEGVLVQVEVRKSFR
mgnify:CR=1 FL=1